MNSDFLDRHFAQSAQLTIPHEQAFELLDDFERLGAHMMRPSWRMAGSHMRYEFDAARGRSPGARIRLTGSVFGVPLEIEEQVIERDAPLRKSWVTVGTPRMLVMRAYRMGFTLAPSSRSTSLEVFIDYALPLGGLGRVLGRLFADVYARWCVRNMVDAARQSVTPYSLHTLPALRRE